MRAEEVPRLICPLVARVASDVTTPYDDGSSLGQRGCHRRRLWVVEQHDVASPDPVEHAGGVRDVDGGVVSRLGSTEAAPVAVDTMEAVMDPLGDREEVCVPTDH